MSDTKWTPGPWLAEIESAHTGSVATCQWDGQPWWEVWSPNWMDGGSAKANAHLIAAAPELYSELKDVLRSARKDFPAGHDGEREFQTAYEGPINALSKARGES